MPYTRDEVGNKKHYIEPERKTLHPRRHHKQSRIPYLHHHYLKIALYDTTLEGVYAIQLLIEDYWFCEFLESQYQLDVYGLIDQPEIRQTRRKDETKAINDEKYPHTFPDYVQMVGDSILTVFATCHPNPLTGNELDTILTDCADALIMDANHNYCTCHRQPFIYSVKKADAPTHHLAGYLMEMTENGYLTRTSYDKIPSKRKRFSYRYWPF
jgi:hypothetical protein